MPGGLLVRRIHRGASHLFIASIVLHLLRVLLTGAFRKPRELNYHLGIGLLTLAIAEGFLGYSLPYDSLAGTGIRIAYSELLSLPFIGDSVAFWIFGGEFPTGDVIPRFHALHVFILPLAIVGAVGLHLLLVVRQKHTQFPRRGIDGHRWVTGKPLWPMQFAESTTLLLWVGGLLAAAARDRALERRHPAGSVRRRARSATTPSRTGSCSGSRACCASSRRWRSTCPGSRSPGRSSPG